MLANWPQRTRMWSTPSGKGYWLKARPKADRASCPVLHLPGTNEFSSEPDGVFVFLQPCRFADVMCIEVCNTLQNLHDKRSRFMPSVTSSILRCRRGWLTEEIRVQNGGSQPRWRAAGTFPRSMPPTSDIELPVRHLRVLFALPDAEYGKCVGARIGAPHEFFCAQRVLGNYTSQPVQRFLRRMSIAAQYFTDPPA